MTSPRDHHDTPLTQSPSKEQSLNAAPSQGQPMDGSSRPASKQNFIKDQLQVGWTFGRLDRLLNEKGPSEMESEKQHKTAATSGKPSPLLDAITDDSATPEMSAVPSLDDQDLDLGMHSDPTPENSDMEDDPPLRIEPAQSVEHEQSGENSEPLSVKDQDESAIPVNATDNDDETVTAISAAASNIDDTRVGDDDEGMSATPQAKDTQSDTRPEATAAPVDNGDKPTKGGHDHLDMDNTSDPQESQSSSAACSDTWMSYVTCARCEITKPQKYFYHFRVPGKKVKTCSICRQLTNEKNAARRLSEAASREKKRSEGTLPTRSAQLNKSAPRGMSAVPATGMDLDEDEDDQGDVCEPQPKKGVHVCPSCDEAMPEDKFLRDGYSMRSCNDCAAREHSSRATLLEEDDSHKSTAQSQGGGARDILTEAQEEAVKDIVSQVRSNRTKRQRASVDDDDTVSAKKPRTHESSRLEIEDAGFLDLGVPEQTRRACDDDIDELSAAFTAFPVGGDGQVSSQKEQPTGATTEP